MSETKNENYLIKWQHPRQSRLECKRLPQGSQNVQELSYHIRRKWTKLKERRNEDWKIKIQWKRPFNLEQNKEDYTDIIETYFSHDWTIINAVRNFNPHAD